MRYAHGPWRMVLLTISAVVILLLQVGSACGADLPPVDCSATPIADLDLQRLMEVRRLAGGHCSELWPGWESAPAGVILVTPPCEYLVWSAGPAKDFQRLDFDSSLGSEVLVRKRVFDTTMQAAFPAVNGVPTVVIGRLASTQPMASVSWILTVLHEHFHQWQQTDTSYGPQTIALGLSGGDRTGMWMLNYPFPYDSAAIQDRFADLSHALVSALDAVDSPHFRQLVKKFIEARDSFQQALSPNDYRYFSFQLWQEGVARYTEYRMAEIAAGDSSSWPSDSLYGKAAVMIRNRILTNLANPDLGSNGRIAFYSVGAAEALLLDRLSPNWHSRYHVERFSLDPYFSE